MITSQPHCKPSWFSKLFFLSPRFLSSLLTPPFVTDNPRVCTPCPVFFYPIFFNFFFQAISNFPPPESISFPFLLHSPDFRCCGNAFSSVLVFELRLALRLFPDFRSFWHSFHPSADVVLTLFLCANCLPPDRSPSI